MCVNEPSRLIAGHLMSLFMCYCMRKDRKDALGTDELSVYRFRSTDIAAFFSCLACMFRIHVLKRAEIPILTLVKYQFYGLFPCGFLC